MTNFRTAPRSPAARRPASRTARAAGAAAAAALLGAVALFPFRAGAQATAPSAAEAAPPPKPSPDGTVTRAVEASVTTAPAGSTPAVPTTLPATSPTTAPPTAPTTAPATLPAEPLAWGTDLQAGIDDAQRRGRLIVVEVGAEWCGWCRKLEAEIATPAVQARLVPWTRVRLDADRDGEQVRALAVGPIPALRVLSSTGRVVATRDGFLAADELAAWLETQRLVAVAAGEPIGNEPADAPAAAALVLRLTDADAVVREAATRRLLRRPDVSAGPVVEAFAAGKLPQRLAALELLSTWDAPLEQLDPWVPASVTPQRVESLKRWARRVATDPPKPSTNPAGTAALPAATLAAARRDLATMLQAPTDAEARAARERLVRAGEALMPEVHEALRAAANDRDRERLVALRYRLVASDALALAWPGGFDRLAASDPQSRQRALEELAAKATAQDAPLLLEMFSDVDPMVREGSLRLLQRVGGEGMTAGLVKLLRDPEPNVRAAVLKQLAVAPVPGMDAEVVKFAKDEPDADLVVHAVRVLRESKSKPAVDGLMGLLSHASWRVRAEAAESLGKKVERYSMQPSGQTADVYAAMINLLDDPDGFVVSRAVMVLKDARMAAAYGPMVKAAERRPELAADVVKALSSGGSWGTSDDREKTNALMIRHLRTFCAHADANVRAAAVTGLASVAQADAADELAKGLADASPKVRAAAAKAALSVLGRQRPQGDETVSTGGLLGFGGGQQQRRRDMEAWLTAFRAGKERPAWLAPMAEPLEKLLDGTEEERLAAAPLLAAFGRDERTAPLLRELAAAAGTNAAARQAVIDALAWVPWEQRLALYNDLLARLPAEQLPYLVRGMTVLAGPGTADVLWATVAREGADDNLASAVHSGLMQSYLGQSYYFRGDGSDASRAKPLVDGAKPKAAGGTDLQRLVALVLLVAASPADAVEPAEQIVRDRPANDPLRADAFQAVLVAKPEREAQAAAVAALNGEGNPDWEMRKRAATYLSVGPDGLRQFRGSIYLNTSRVHDTSSTGERTAIIVQAPRGLKAEGVRPLLADTDPANAAAAGYLLCVLGDRAGLEPLLTHYRDRGRSDQQWQRLVFRAVAAINDDALTPVLAEVYKEMGSGDYYAREFYWTIRSMGGPNVLKLRKQMRDEIGMDNLR